MIDPDQQRLQELQALTQSSREAPQPSLMISQIRPSAQQGSTEDPPVEPSDDAFTASTSDPEQSQMPPTRDVASVAFQANQPLASFSAASPAGASRGTQPTSLVQGVQQTASTTLKLRDQREFQLTVEQDASRDDALVDRLAEQTVAIVQQRDETLYQRVMQAIEQRLAQGKSSFS